jgi:hypothetical protein
LGRNIYITSDEKPKAGDWSLYQNKIHKCIEDIVGDEFKKIILTTDQDLIKDGVQAISDEFLEWFVKNPSCEKVKVADYGNVLFDDKIFHVYKIIIPQEEPKQKQKESLIEIMRGDEELGLYDEPKQIKCYCGHTTYCDCGPQEERACTQDVVDSAMKAVSKDVRLPKIVRDGLVTKQETLKKASLQYRLSTNNKMGIEQVAFESGAKWQAERMYSEEEVLELLQKALTHQDDGEIGSLVTVQGQIRTANFYSWFEQFKKK